MISIGNDEWWMNNREQEHSLKELKYIRNKIICLGVDSDECTMKNE